MYKVAFFGSDLFSLASLKALHQLKIQKPGLIGNLDLYTRKLKPSGRGQKNIVIPEIVTFAKTNNIHWHEIENNDDFKNISTDNEASNPVTGMKETITSKNLAIAVSYGKLIPQFFLKSLKFGGLNVHPSILPQYRGSSPLQMAILNQDKYTGVSIQTLHPTKFDHGIVIDQSIVKLSDRETTDSLSSKLATIGANQLIHVLQTTDLHTPKAVNLMTDLGRLQIASRIPSSLQELDFNQTIEAADAKGRALGKLFFLQNVLPKSILKSIAGCLDKSISINVHQSNIRVNLHDFDIVTRVEEHKDVYLKNVEMNGSVPMLGFNAKDEPLVALKLLNGYIGAKFVTVQNYKRESAIQFFKSFKKRRLYTIVR
ncbi:methionyl-tRNA formyltransferase [Starmerella bacillaris]|uniref:methionyl-tRNA formyltransferase n=1 Tax=Starmerella bacillaris TaxID=1247836 RepID=A0AAV5RLG8_STABA|nr:methionyl-tRNA formyltransferase [Starmerella bacillaris]